VRVTVPIVHIYFGNQQQRAEATTEEMGGIQTVESSNVQVWIFWLAVHHLLTHLCSSLQYFITVWCHSTSDKRWC